MKYFHIFPLRKHYSKQQRTTKALPLNFKSCSYNQPHPSFSYHLQHQAVMKNTCNLCMRQARRSQIRVQPQWHSNTLSTNKTERFNWGQYKSETVLVNCYCQPEIVIWQERNSTEELSFSDWPVAMLIRDYLDRGCEGHITLWVTPSIIKWFQAI